MANKFYSFPYNELTFDNPFEDPEIKDLVGKTLYSLYQEQESRGDQSEKKHSEEKVKG